MRMLKYKMELVDDGYIVASGDMRGNLDLLNSGECLPIQLTMLHLYRGNRCVHDLGDCVDPAELYSDPNRSEEFRANYREILQGKRSDRWYLYSFTVADGYVVLQYHQCGVAHNEIITLPGWDDVGLELQFAVPHRGKKHDSKYIVQLSPRRKNAHVSEFVGATRREIDIYSEPDDKSMFTTRYAIISEFVDP